jgi:L-fucose mutarotase/ribose pyranase (RbsD/FucU family)
VLWLLTCEAANLVAVEKEKMKMDCVESSPEEAIEQRLSRNDPLLLIERDDFCETVREQHNNSANE